MLITSTKIKSKLRRIWPNLKWIWPTNPEWEVISEDWLNRIMERCSVRHMVTIPGIWECENYAHQWKANVETFQYELYQSGEYRPEWRWAVAECLGMQPGTFGGTMVHSLNLLVTDSGISLFEPQEDKLGITDFTPFFLKF